MATKEITFEVVPRPRWWQEDHVRLEMVTHDAYGRIRRRRQFTVPLDDLKAALKAAEILEVKEVLVERSDSGSEAVALATMYAGLLSVNRTTHGEKTLTEVRARLKKALGLTDE